MTSEHMLAGAIAGGVTILVLVGPLIWIAVASRRKEEPIHLCTECYHFIEYDTCSVPQALSRIDVVTGKMTKSRYVRASSKRRSIRYGVRPTCPDYGKRSDCAALRPKIVR